MRLKQIVYEDFVNYKKPCMFLGTCQCDWKCCTEQGLDNSICQNSSLAQSPVVNIPADEIFRRYIDNPISKSIVLGGLEPMLQISEVIELIQYFREHGNTDDFIIYTGYYPDEIEASLIKLRSFPNIIVKFGRYKPNDTPHYDEVLGVELASSNQFALKIS